MQPVAKLRAVVELHSIFERLTTAIDAENESLKDEGLELLASTEIRMMGQMSLLINAEVRAQIRLFGTADVDATVRGEYWIQKKFAEILLEEGLELDPVADEIWLPEGATFSEIYSSEILRCLRLDPLYALLSKAIKAKEKTDYLSSRLCHCLSD